MIDRLFIQIQSKQSHKNSCRNAVYIHNIDLLFKIGLLIIAFCIIVIMDARIHKQNGSEQVHVHVHIPFNLTELPEYIGLVSSTCTYISNEICIYSNDKLDVLLLRNEILPSIFIRLLPIDD